MSSKKKKKTEETSEQPKGASLRANLELFFVDAFDPKELATFRHLFVRRPRLTDHDVITMQEVRDVVLYQCATPLPLDLIDIIHSESVDNFLRALILYMQQFLQVHEQLQRRQKTREGQLTLGALTQVELGWQRDLADLRQLLAREHCALLLATEPSLRRLHHLEGGRGGTTTSRGERDIRCFEMLWRLAARFAHVALERPPPGVVVEEMNRLLRSPVFTRAAHSTRVRRTGIDEESLSFAPRTTQNYMQRVLHGPRTEAHNKYFTRSPAALAALGSANYRLMAVGQIHFGREEERLQRLWEAMVLPEEMLAAAGLTLGLLGKPRADYDLMLAPLQKEEDEEEQDEATITTLSMLDIEAQSVEIPLRSGLDLPHPSAAAPPTPTSFPQRPWTPPQEIAAYHKAHAEEREKARRRWRRWIINGSRRRLRRKMSPVEGEAARSSSKATNSMMELQNIGST